MTIVAVTTARYVCRVFAACRDAVMAGAAGAENLCVVYGNGRLKGNGVVAVLTTRGCLDMRLTLAGRRGAIVATNAVPHDARVIEQSGQPGGRIVTVVALVPRRYMRRCLSSGLDAVVTADATAGNRRVIHERDYFPVGSNVTVGALSCGCNVTGRF